MDKEIPLVYSKYDTLKDISTLTRVVSFNGHTVPQNFTTDFTTTYWYIRWGIPRFGRANLAAVVHDWQYVNPLFTSRKEADENFRLNLIALGFSKAAARIYWMGVRLGGGKSFNDGRKQQLNPKVIAREARAETRSTGLLLERHVAAMVENCTGVIDGVTRIQE